MPIGEVKEPTKTLTLLRSGNQKKYTCEICGKEYPSRQALAYHHNKAVNNCKNLKIPEKFTDDLQAAVAATAPEIPPAPPGPPPDHNPGFIRREEGPSEDPCFEGDSPPLPGFLIFILVFLCGLIAIVILSWETLWKFWQKYGGKNAGE